jgi:hypothetical protein
VRNQEDMRETSMRDFDLYSFTKHIFDEQIKVTVMAGNVARVVGSKNSYKIS